MIKGLRDDRDKYALKYNQVIKQIKVQTIRKETNKDDFIYTAFAKKYRLIQHHINHLINGSDNRHRFGNLRQRQE